MVHALHLPASSSKAVLRPGTNTVLGPQLRRAACPACGLRRLVTSRGRPSERSQQFLAVGLCQSVCIFTFPCARQLPVGGGVPVALLDGCVRTDAKKRAKKHWPRESKKDRDDGVGRRMENKEGELCLRHATMSSARGCKTRNRRMEMCNRYRTGGAAHHGLGVWCWGAF